MICASAGSSKALPLVTGSHSYLTNILLEHKKRKKSKGGNADINWISNLNEDILHLVFEHFDLQPGSHFDHQPGSPTILRAQARKDLFSAAKTCKAFVEPALNSLWRVLPSLLPLLLLLPSAEVRANHYVSSRLSLSSLYLSRRLSYFYKVCR